MTLAVPEGLEPIPGMSRRWFYRPSDRRILHQPSDDYPPATFGTQVPQMIGVVTSTDGEGNPVTEYQFIGRRGNVLTFTEYEVKRGTWAGKAGTPRPPAGQVRKAFATIIRREAERAQGDDQQTTTKPAT